MNTVQPIKDMNIVNDISDYLKSKKLRDYVLFNMGLYLPLRISDLLKLKVRDIRQIDGKLKQYISFREQKTGKEQRFRINESLKKILTRYIRDKEDYEFLFPSRQNNKIGDSKAITRQQAYNILNEAARHFTVEKIGCHTTRKTFGYFYYLGNKDIAMLQELFNHSNTNVTKRYIGLTQETKDEALGKFEFPGR